MDKKGKEYEQFVGKLQQAILNSEKYGKQKNIIVEKNKIIQDKNGNNREFDLYWEYRFGGISYKTVIECKDYNSKISIDRIDALLGKIHEIPGLKPVFATKIGYQSGAEKKARDNDIELLIVRKQNDSDWKDEYGFHLLKGITVNTEICKTAQIKSFLPEIDLKWVRENKIDINYIKTLKLCGKTNEVTIEDTSNSEKYTLLDLETHITLSEKKNPGKHEFTKRFDEAYLIHNDIRYKILSFRIEYIVPEPDVLQETVDFTQQLIGVVEYLHKGIKLKIFKNGIIHEENLNANNKLF